MRTTASRLNVPSKYGPRGELFFFLLRKEPTIVEEEDFERVTSSDAEDGRSFSDEEGEHNAENFMLCSFAQHACSPLFQGFLHEEELGKVVLTCHFSVGRVVLPSGLSGSLFFELSDWWSIRPLLQRD